MGGDGSALLSRRVAGTLWSGHAEDTMPPRALPRVAAVTRAGPASPPRRVSVAPRVAGGGAGRSPFSREAVGRPAAEAWWDPGCRFLPRGGTRARGSSLSTSHRAVANVLGRAVRWTAVCASVGGCFHTCSRERPPSMGPLPTAMGFLLLRILRMRGAQAGSASARRCPTAPAVPTVPAGLGL